MLTPVSRNIFSWSTPDPEAFWLMVGHLVLSEGSAILVDPPNVPGLVESVKRLAKPDAIILTTGDHLRGTDYLAGEFSAQVYLPKQEDSDIDEGTAMRIRRMKNVKFFDEGDDLPLGVRSFRARVEKGKSAPNLNEMLLLTNTGELLAGDIAMGSADGGLITRNEFFSRSGAPDPDDNSICFMTIRKVVERSGARSLLASHGFDILDNLQHALEVRIAQYSRIRSS